MSDLAAFLDRAWDALGRGVADGAHPMRTVTLATVGSDGGAEARMVVLRGARRGAGEVETHVDAASAKMDQIAPRATVLAWDPGAQLQLRLRVALRTADADTADERWDAMPQGARRNYGGIPRPGQRLDDPDAYAPGAARERLAVLIGRVDEIDALDLSTTPHARAVFRRNGGFAGEWIAP